MKQKDNNGSDLVGVVLGALALAIVLMQCSLAEAQEFSPPLERALELEREYPELGGLPPRLKVVLVCKSYSVGYGRGMVDLGHKITKDAGKPMPEAIFDVASLMALDEEQKCINQLSAYYRGGE